MDNRITLLLYYWNNNNNSISEKAEKKYVKKRLFQNIEEGIEELVQEWKTVQMLLVIQYII